MEKADWTEISRGLQALQMREIQYFTYTEVFLQFLYASYF